MAATPPRSSCCQVGAQVRFPVKNLADRAKVWQQLWRRRRFALWRWCAWWAPPPPGSIWALPVLLAPAPLLSPRTATAGAATSHPGAVAGGRTSSGMSTTPSTRMTVISKRSGLRWDGRKGEDLPTGEGDVSKMTDVPGAGRSTAICDAETRAAGEEDEGMTCEGKMTDNGSRYETRGHHPRLHDDLNRSTLNLNPEQLFAFCVYKSPSTHAYHLSQNTTTGSLTLFRPRPG